MADEVDTTDVFRIMVATDSHLGYAEKDPIRGDDSFIAFEEMLQLAVEENVDFILLGGDLFHDAVPSQNSLHRCIKLLRNYTFGDKAIEFEVISDQRLNFHNAVNQSVNYEDPNINISIPVFSIHGNHDDPSGFGRLSSLDLLSTAGLVNYFGRWTDLTQVDIKPLLLHKGVTQLALYGLSHIHDARLARLFENYKVNIERPATANNTESDSDPDTEGDNWFNLMVLHQNRADRGPKNYLPEDILPSFLNLVIWGHEHDCRIEPEYNAKKDFYVSQPGSSVATSLAEGEALPKHVGLLKIYKNKFQMRAIPLKTVRPFVFESVNLVELTEEIMLGGGDPSEKVQNLAKDRIEAMIERATGMLTKDPKQPTWPLIRLRLVFADEEQMFNTIRFGQMFNEKVANPTDIVHFKRIVKREKKHNLQLDEAAMDQVINDMEVETSTRVEDLLERYFDNIEGGRKLQIIPTKMLSEMCFQLVEKRDANAVDNLFSNYKKDAVNFLMEKLPNEDEINTQLLVLKDKISQDDINKMLDTNCNITKTNSNTTNSAMCHEFREDSRSFQKENANSAPPPKEKTSSRGSSTRARGAATGRGRGRGSSSNRTSNAVMPELDVSINNTRRSGRNQQPSVLDLVSNSKSSTRSKKAPVYVVSSDDSD